MTLKACIKKILFIGLCSSSFISTSTAPLSDSPVSIQKITKHNQIFTPIDQEDKTPICLDKAPVVGVFMIKNEAHVIEKTLEPYVNGGIQHFYIFDTGSTDNTVEVVKKYFKRKGLVHAYIGQEAFVDFATSRNRGLDLAHQQFPYASFLLMPDAEWYLHNAEGLIEFCKKAADDTPNSYLVRIGNEYINFYTSRLIRNNGHSRFVGVVHEDISDQQEKDKAPNDIYFEWDPSSRGIEKTEQRWRRDKELLLKKFKENSTDSRTVFYLAQTYDCLYEDEAALNYYRLRATMQGGPEENFMSLYRMGQMYERLMEKNNKYTWAQALDLYLKAYQYRQERAEPLISIAQHYAKEKNWALAFMFAQRACQIPYPEHDTLFIEDYGYNFLRYNILSESSWFIKECEIGLKATEYLLANNYSMPHLKHNLSIFKNCVARSSAINNAFDNTEEQTYNKN